MPVHAAETGVVPQQNKAAIDAPQIQTSAPRDLKAQDIFREAKKSVYQIRVINTKSGQKSAIGSGFRLFEGSGFITNFHVISEAALKPKEFVLEYLDNDGNKGALNIRNIDVVHDLALLSAKEDDVHDHSDYLEMPGPKTMEQGVRIFSIGNPHDLGMTIVEGVYNGYLEKSLYEKILFSGALNSGMSGGPALDESGRVIGVNVATSGDDLGHLVPISYVIELIKPQENFKSWSDVVRQQLLYNSQYVVAQVNTQEWKTKKFGDFSIPEGIHPAFKCWGVGHSETADKNRSYAKSLCRTEDDIFISSALTTGRIEYSVIDAQSQSMNPLAFNKYYQWRYGDTVARLTQKSVKDVGKFECKTDFVDLAHKSWKIAYCARPYKKYKGVFDTFVKAAQLNETKAGFVFEIFLDGFDKNDAQDFVFKFLGAVE